MNQQQEKVNIESFKKILSLIEATRTPMLREDYMQQLFSLPGFKIHYQHGSPKRIVLAEFYEFEHAHEFKTASKIAATGYDVLFVPKGYFNSGQKRFDVFMSRGHILLPADLKCIISKKPDTIAKRIKGGSEQANRVILDITSDIDVKSLIDGLRSGCERNEDLIEVVLFFRSKCHFLLKERILSKHIFKILK